MKTCTLLSIAAGLALCTQAAVADITITGAPVSRRAGQSIQGKYELMATNAVRAVFQGTQDKNGVQEAVFEVKENLAYRRFVRYGDGALQPGNLFTITMNGATPGQPAEIIEEINKLKPGQEAIMKIDHIFIFGEQQGQNVRPCTRIARREVAPPAPAPAAPAQPAPTTQQNAPQQNTPAQTAAAPAATPLPSTVAPLPTTVAPLNVGSPRFRGESVSTSISVRPDGKGGMVQERTDTVTKYDPATGQVTTRMYINGQEVDPKTRQPIK
ncbi:MAG: hypothetical protein Q4F38_04670 [Akkermansia sp.]|nr:hypothetical protein [Akkermansia sp.]